MKRHGDFLFDALPQHGRSPVGPDHSWATLLPFTRPQSMPLPIGAGFSRLANDPAGDRVDSIGGAPGSAVGRETLDKLAQLLHTRLPGPPEARENEQIPAGYTYFWQFVAHDMVQSAVSIAQLPGAGYQIDNTRRQFLGLQTIYGDGPVNSTHLYQSHQPGQPRRSSPLPNFLRLGAFRARLDGVPPTCPYRDIARRNLAEKPDHTLPDVLIADPRNDDHAILAQMSAIFQLLHNGIVARLNSATSGRLAKTGLAGDYDRFMAARLTVMVLYRLAIRRDLLRRLLLSTVHRAYETAGGPLLRTFSGIPVEYAFGASRVAHVMIREDYRLNAGNSFDITALLENTSSGMPGGMPLDTDWIVAWSRFFEIGAEKPNLSMRLAPCYANFLVTASRFPAIDQFGAGKLAYRDLLSSVSVGMPPVTRLVDCLAASHGPFQDLFPDGRSVAPSAGEIAGWLVQSRAAGPVFDLDEIDALSRNPPLPFFLMHEAQLHPGSEGRCLGPAGSIIVAETIYGALADTCVVPGELTMDRAALLGEIGRLFDSPGLFDVLQRDTADIADEGMPGLIRITARIAGLERAEPEFL